MTEHTNGTEGVETAGAGPERAPSRFRAWRNAGLFVLAATLVAAFLQRCCGGVASSDGFFHYRQAADYLQYGRAASLTPFSHCALGHVRADIWYGFHLFLMPFARVGNPFFGLQAATAGEVVLALIFLYVAGRRLRLPYPWAWPFLLLLFSPTAAHVLLKARPHVLSAGLAPLLLALLITGPRWGVLLVAAALTWVHPSFLWVIPLLAGVVFVVKGLSERVWEWRGAGAALLGIAVGLLARPHPWAAMKLQYVQLVTLQLARSQHLPIDFGAELDPMTWARWSERFLLTPVLWVGAVGIVLAALLRRADLAPRMRTVLWSTLLCAAGFFVMTMVMSYRAVPLWTAFTSLSIATSFGYLVLSPEAKRGRWFAAETRMLLGAALGIFMVILGWQVVDDYALKRAWVEPPAGHLQGPGEWLREYSQPGDLVANISWDAFPELYFWSPRNRYLYGMDPIFLYAENPRMFWKVRHLNDRAAEFTTDGPAFPKGRRTDTYTFLRDEVGARYVFVQVRRLPALDVYLSTDPRFARRYGDDQVRLYEVLPSPAR